MALELQPPPSPPQIFLRLSRQCHQSVRRVDYNRFNNNGAMTTRLHEAAVGLGRKGLESLCRLHSNRNTTHLRSISSSSRAIAANNVKIAKLHANLNNTSAPLIHRPNIFNNTRCYSSSTINFDSDKSKTISNSNDQTITTNNKGGDKGIFAKIWDRYSFQGQQKRIILGERLFRSAQYRANDPRWYTEGRIPFEFRPRHAMITMHVWFLHKRLLIDTVDPHLALLVQEELFDILWNDTRARIRAEGVNELTVNKHLKDVQQLTFMHLTHYDHAFQEFANDDGKRFEELAGVIWIHVLNRDEEAYNDQLKRLAAYVEYQYVNLMHGVPDEYFWEGRIPWGDVPVFADMKDNDGKALDDTVTEVEGLERLPEPWVKTLTDAGSPYYWNTDTNVTSWKKPTL